MVPIGWLSASEDALLRRVVYACPSCEFQKSVYSERFECAAFQKFTIGESECGSDAPELGLDVTDGTITFFVREDKKRLISRDAFAKLSMFMERVDDGFVKGRRGRLGQCQIVDENAYDDEDCALVAEAQVRQGLKPAILNLASRFSPGGGYHDGTSAQEESLCQTSTLSQSLYQYGDPKYKHIRESGVPHRFVAYPLHQRFGGIYTPEVTFFRHGIRAVFAFRKPEEWFRAGVITVPALSFRETNKYNNAELEFRAADGGFTPEGEAIMLDKIRTIYRAALRNGHDALVLGAFGCGVFKLRPDRVAELFARVLHEDEFDSRFKAVVFAIKEGRGTARNPVEEQGKFAPFYSIFGRL